MFHCSLCEFETPNRHQIHFHHIKSRELCGTNDINNIIELCANCHNKVYIPDSKHGIHSIKAKNSIILLRKVLSSGGMMINYLDSQGKEQFKELTNAQVFKSLLRFCH